MNQFASLAEFAAYAKEGARKAELATERLAPMTARGDRGMWDKIYLHPEPNEQDCAFCRAMSTCPAARAQLEKTVSADFEVISETDEKPAAVLATSLATADSLGADVDTFLGKLMASTGFLEDWIKAVRAEVERRLLLGEKVEGYGLELGRQGARNWTDPKAVEELFRKKFRLPMEVVYDMKLISPTTAETLAKVVRPSKKNPTPTAPKLKALHWDQLQPLIVRSDPQPSVKPEYLIKEPYSPVQPDADAFDVIVEEPKPAEPQGITLPVDNDTPLW